jgi:hypothetical protein
MAYFVELDENNEVIRNVAVANEVITDDQGNEQEQLGVVFLNNLFNSNSVWKKTSYNTRGGKYYDSVTNLLAEDQSKAFRKNYANPGYKYDPITDSFIESDARKPYSDWIMDINTGLWKAPVDQPLTWFYNGALSNADGYSVDLQRFLGFFPETEGSETRKWFSYNNSNNSWELMDPQPTPVS